MNRLIEQKFSLVLAFAFLAVGLSGCGSAGASGGTMDTGAAPEGGQQLSAADRYTIMVPDLAPRNDAGARFGRRVAGALRDDLSELYTHETVSGRELTRARRDYDLSAEDLYECIRARQLGMQMNWGLVLCGEYEPVGDGQVRVDATFVGAEDGNEFEVPTFTVSDREPDQAAQTILETFDRWQTQLRHTVFCRQYMESQDWDAALRNCNQALDINPGSLPALYQKAFILREMGDRQAALDVLETLMEVDPLHQDALKLAGITATEAGMIERGREYFSEYMELNPNDVGVRLATATDIANAGDPAAAMQFAQEGLEIEPDNLTLITYIGHFAAQAAGRAESSLNAARQGNAPSGPPVDPSMVTEYYETAAEAYQRVFAEMGAETEPQILERLIVALFKLQRYEDAVELGAEAVDLDPENPQLWDAYSRALQEAGRPGEALAAVERTQELGRESPSLTQRKAVLQLRAGQDQGAVATLIQGVEAGQFPASSAFGIVFGNAYSQKFQRGQLQPAYDLLEAAGPLAVEEEDRLTRNFWRGYILFEQAKAAHEPMTAESAQRAKPLFERALELFQAARGYEQYHESANVPQFIDQAQRFIEIEEALIRRGR